MSLPTRAGFPLVVAVALIAAGCWKMGWNEGWPDGGGGGPSDADTDSDTDADSDTDSDTDVDTELLPDDCEEGAIWIYAVSHDGRLYSLDPTSADIDLIGEIDCPTDAATFSMAVTRDGIAHVLTYAPDALECAGIWAVDIFTAECLGLTAFDCENPAGYSLFGMGYAADDDDPTSETLYVSRGWQGLTATGLASLDADSWDVTPVAPLDGWGELAGTAAGELWGFFGHQDPKQLARIDKATGEIDEVVTLGMLSGTAGTAVAFWGGDFYVFWSATDSGEIYRVSDGEVALYATIPFQAVGAGSSTCAPLEAPPEED